VPPLGGAGGARAIDAGPGKEGGDSCAQPSCPGTPVYAATQAGTGACAGKTLGQVIAAVYQLRPDLADIRTIVSDSPEGTGDGKLIYAFAGADGFKLVFQRGDGDCPAGCINNEYWYFATGATCEPQSVGHYGLTFDSTGNCFKVVGEPPWSLPRGKIDPTVVCGADNHAQNISGDYAVHGTGMRVACTAKLGAEPSVPVDTKLGLTVAQTAGDLTHGTVTFTGTGDARIDGIALDAKFTRRRFTAERSKSNLPAMCIDEENLAVTLDLETDQPGRFAYTEVRSPGCPPSQDYCKGGLWLELTVVK
jgi:hypothetical protein